MTEVQSNPAGINNADRAPEGVGVGETRDSAATAGVEQTEDDEFDD